MGKGGKQFFDINKYQIGQGELRVWNDIDYLPFRRLCQCLMYMTQGVEWYQIRVIAIRGKKVVITHFRGDDQKAFADYLVGLAGKKESLKWAYIIQFNSLRGKYLGTLCWNVHSNAKLLRRTKPSKSIDFRHPLITLSCDTQLFDRKCLNNFFDGSVGNSHLLF